MTVLPLRQRLSALVALTAGGMGLPWLRRVDVHSPLLAAAARLARGRVAVHRVPAQPRDVLPLWCRRRCALARPRNAQPSRRRRSFPVAVSRVTRRCPRGVMAVARRRHRRCAPARPRGILLSWRRRGLPAVASRFAVRAAYVMTVTQRHCRCRRCAPA